MVVRRIRLWLAGAIVGALGATVVMQPAQARVLDTAESSRPVVIGYSSAEILREKLAELRAQRAAARAAAEAEREAERAAAALAEHFAGTASLNLPQPTTVLMGQFGAPIPLGGMAMVDWTQWGLRYRAGEQGSKLTITYSDDGIIHLRDTGTGAIRSLGTGCTSVEVEAGIGVDCQIPENFAATKMYLEIWPRLGDDTVDARTLPSKFDVWFLADGGDDVFYGGDGDDFFNGAFQHDIAYGGAGNDWLRGGPESDRLDGGTGSNKVVP